MEQIILFIFLAIFPLGQIIRIGFVQPIDIVAGAGALWVIFKRLKKPEAFNYLEAFLLAAGFSWVVSLFAFGQKETIYGLLYFLRLIAYFYFIVTAYNFAKLRKINSDLLTNSLLFVSLFSALFGWIQYFSVPGIKPFAVWGWDDHLYRIVGTFLDPGYLGLVLVFGALIAIQKLIVSKKNIYLAGFIFLFITLAFTYSRASYLALFAGLGAIAFSYRIFIKKYLVLAGIFILLMLSLPTSKNHVLSFTRSFSAINRVDNYKETIRIFKTSPVFGVGYNNLCLAKAKVTGTLNLKSHACSGSDSSILYILATTGIVGLLAFVYGFYKLSGNIRGQTGGVMFNSFLAALFVHSLFSNSVFYSWILGYMAIMIAVFLGSKIKR